MRAHPRALVGGRVPVVRRSAHAGYVELGECGELVVGEGLGRREVEDGGTVVGEDGGQARQPHGEGLAR